MIVPLEKLVRIEYRRVPCDTPVRNLCENEGSSYMTSKIILMEEMVFSTTLSRGGMIVRGSELASRRVYFLCRNGIGTENFLVSHDLVHPFR